MDLRRVAASTFASVTVVTVCSLVACSRFGGDEREAEPAADSDAGRVLDSGPTADGSARMASETPPPGDAGKPRCSPTGAFGPPQGFAAIVPPAPATVIEGLRFSSDELTAYFWVNVTGDPDKRDFDLYQSHRDRVGGDWSSPQPLTPLNALSLEDALLTVTSDRKTAYFNRGGIGDRQIFFATRADAALSFGTATRLQFDSAVPTGADDSSAWINRSNTTMYFASHGRAGGTKLDLYQTKISDGRAGTLELVPGASKGDSTDSYPVLTADELTIYFKSKRLSDEGDIFVAHRASIGADFAPVEVKELSTDAQDFPLWVSDDGCILYYRNDTAIRFVSRGLQ